MVSLLKRHEVYSVYLPSLQAYKRQAVEIAAFKIQNYLFLRFRNDRSSDTASV